MIDTSIVVFVNGFAHKSALLDHAIDLTIGRPLIKTGLYTGLLWYLWFRIDRQAAKEQLVAAVGLAFFALILARALALSLPFRDRPLHDATIAFIRPYGIDADDLIDWSSFPSDHAALFFALSVGIFLVSRGWGIVALLFTALMVCLPRLYAGYHYPSDLLAGALIGISCGSLAASPAIRQLIAALPMRLWQAKPELFYTVFFFVAFEITNNFEDLRRAARDTYRLLSTL